MVDVPTSVQFNALAQRVSNLESLGTSLGNRVSALEGLPTPTPPTPTPTPTPPTPTPTPPTPTPTPPTPTPTPPTPTPTPPTPTPTPPAESADQTQAPPATAIIDSAGNRWTIISSQVGLNGSPVSGLLSGLTVTLLVYVAHVVWVQVSNGNWYSLKVSGGVASVASGPTTVSPLTTPIASNRTEDFLKIWGVQGKIGTGSAPYVNATGVSADAAYIGVRQFRDELNATGTTQIAALQALFNKGITFVAGPPGGGGTLIIADLLAGLKQWVALGANAIYAVEGSNEPFYAPFTYNGAIGGGTGDWTAVANFQRDWRAAIRGDSAVSSLPVLSPAQVAHENPNVGLQWAVIPSGDSSITLPAGTQYWDGAAIYLHPSLEDGVSQTIDEAGDHIMGQLRRDFVNAVPPTPTPPTPTPTPTPAGALVNGPISGAAPGTWQSGNFTAGGITQHYTYLLPHGYDSTRRYRAIMHLHWNQQAFDWYAAGGGGPGVDNLTPAVDGYYNTSGFRAAYPAIVIVPFCDQSAGNGAFINFGGATTARQNAETNAIAMLANFVSNFAIDSTRCFVIGTSMGAIAAWAWAVRYNTINGTISKVIRGFLPFDGNPFEFIGGVAGDGTYPSGVVPSGIITQLTNVPIWSVHGSQDQVTTWGSGVDVRTWDEPIYRAWGGITPGSGNKAPNSQEFFYEPNVGHGSWDANIPLPNGKGRFDWMFAF